MRFCKGEEPRRGIVRIVEYVAVGRDLNLLFDGGFEEIQEGEFKVWRRFYKSLGSNDDIGTLLSKNLIIGQFCKVMI